MRVSDVQVTLFARQLAAMLQGGVPLVRALECLGATMDDRVLGEAISGCAGLVSSGHRFSASLGRFPGVFPPLFASMMALGEEVGQLDATLDKLASWMERDAALRRSVVAAVRYPLGVLCAALLLSLVLFTFVMPGFVDVFRQMHAELPWVTRLVLALTEAVRHPLCWLLAVALGAGAVRGVRLSTRELAGRGWWFAQLGRVPGLGALLRSGSRARYATGLSTLLGQGLLLTRAVALAATASGNPLLELDVERLTRDLRHGSLLSEAMGVRQDLYGDTLVHFLRAGEEASLLSELVARAAVYYENDTAECVQGLSAVAEPVLLLGVALVVGTVLLAIFLPLYSQIGAFQ